VSCKACRHECPTGVDMAKMKIEVLAARAARHGLSLRDRLVGYLPRYAGLASRFAPLANWRNNSSCCASCSSICRHQRAACTAEWRRDVFRSDVETLGPADGAKSCCSPILSTAPMSGKTSTPRCAVLVEGGYRVHIPKPADGGRPLCCGRTFLSAGLVDHARAELDRLVTTYAPFALRGVPSSGWSRAVC